jgi:hypothetical protein
MDEERCSLHPIEARLLNIDVILAFPAIRWMSAELPIRLPRAQLSDVAR